VKQSVFFFILLIVAIVTGYVIWAYMLPDYLREGGPLVAGLISMLVLLIGFIIERWLTLRSARGKASVQAFFKKVITMLNSGDFEGAIAACDKQRGSVANIIRAGIERYNAIKDDAALAGDKKVEETQRAIDEANSLEVPLLERNLIALSTIASIATMWGLLGTTIGMIRAFAATGHRKGGVIDAQQLAVGISEALVNTAGGLTNAILGIIAYNVFVNKVDAFNYTIDEASYEVMQLIKGKEGK
jgi:biopolymer transport protein ExbB